MVIRENANSGHFHIVFIFQNWRLPPVSIMHLQKDSSLYITFKIIWNYVCGRRLADGRQEGGSEMR